MYHKRTQSPSQAKPQNMNSSSRMKTKLVFLFFLPRQWQEHKYKSQLRINLTFVYNNGIEEFFRAGIWCLENKKGEKSVIIVINTVTSLLFF